jgi:bifunctional non-homologous end joining protein LigD
MLSKEVSTAGRIQPIFIEPMQVVPVAELPDGGAWSYEAKLDGYRCLAAKRGSGVVLWSRNGKGFTDRFPQIVRACEKLPADTLIDGEVIVLDENGRCRFNALQRSSAKRPYPAVCFRYIDATRAQRSTSADRGRRLLTEALRKVEYPVIQSIPFNVKPAEVIRAAKELELEGVIAKRNGSIYETN